MSVQIDASELTAAAAILDAGSVGAAIDHAMDPAIAELGRDIQRNVRDAGRSHRRTGRMEAAVTVGSAGPGGGIEITAGPPANLIVGGTRAHEIRAHGHALRLDGASIPFAGVVHHPGTRADPFVARGIDRSGPDIADALDTAGAEIVHTLAAALGGS